MVTLMSVNSWGRLKASILKCTAGCTFMETRYLSGGQEESQWQLEFRAGHLSDISHHYEAIFFYQLHPQYWNRIDSDQPGFWQFFSWTATLQCTGGALHLLLYFVFFSFGDILVFRSLGCRAGAPYLLFYAFCLLLYARQPIRLYAYISLYARQPIRSLLQSADVPVTAHGNLLCTGGWGWNEHVGIKCIISFKKWDEMNVNNCVSSSQSADAVVTILKALGNSV